MNIVNNARFPLEYTVTGDPPSSDGSILGGGQQNAAVAWMVKGSYNNIGSATANSVPDNATVTFTIENSQVYVTISY